MLETDLIKLINSYGSFGVLVFLIMMVANGAWRASKYLAVNVVPGAKTFLDRLIETQQNMIRRQDETHAALTAHVTQETQKAVERIVDLNDNLYHDLSNRLNEVEDRVSGLPPLLTKGQDPSLVAEKMAHRGDKRQVQTGSALSSARQYRRDQPSEYPGARREDIP